MILDKLLYFFQTKKEPTTLIYKNLFISLKNALHDTGYEPVLSNLDIISEDVVLKKQFEKIFANYYLKSYKISSCKSTSVKACNNLRYLFIFYSTVFMFCFSSFLIIFCKNYLSSDMMAILSAILGASGSCLKEIFDAEFKNSSSIVFKSQQYILDMDDEA